MSETVRLTIVKAMPMTIEITLDDVLRSASDEQVRAECTRRGLDASCEVDTLTGAQVRAARALLDWPLHRLADVSGVSVSTIKRLEDGPAGSARPSRVSAIRRALESGGARFVLAGGLPAVVQAEPSGIADLSPDHESVSP